MTSYEELKNRIIATDPSELSYSAISEKLSTASALARVSSNQIFVIDHHKQKFLFLENRPLFTQIPIEYVSKVGFDFYRTDLFDKSEKDRAHMIHLAVLRFMSDLAFGEMLDYSVCYSLTFKNIYGRPQIIYHQQMPFLLSPSGKLWLSICSVTTGSIAQKENLMIICHQLGRRFSFDWSKKEWIQQQTIDLKPEELFVLQYAVMGEPISQIADKMCKSVDSIKSYRRSIFLKLGVNNITEAITFAKNTRLI